MKKITIIILSFLTLLGVNARNNENLSQNTAPRKPSLNTRGGDCNVGRAQIDLDINNVRTKLQNTGDIWWDRDAAKYGVPKISAQQQQSGGRQVNALFAGAIWISGKDNGNLKIAAIRFSGAGGSSQYWPGPIKKGVAEIDRAQCNKYDRFWKVNLAEIDLFRAGGDASDAIKNWPAKGNKFLSAQGKFTDLSEDLAPFFDANGDDNYDYKTGDYPAIKYVDGTVAGAEASVADEMVFWVLNDVGNVHVVPDGLPIGIQINCLAFAFASSDELGNMTFYTYEVHKKSSGDLTETYMSQFVDCDLGNSQDDYVGCDTTHALGYCVNADDFDEKTTVEGYLQNVPIIAVDFFEGPKVNNKQLGMSSFSYFINSSGTDVSDPNTDVEHRNVQEGKSRTGKSFTVGGDCISGTKPTKYCFPGNPNEPTEWSMCSANYPKRDVRFVQNSGPFTMISGDKQTITVGVIFTQPPVGSYKLCKIDVSKYLLPADEKAQKLFDYGFKSVVGPEAPNMNIRSGQNQLFFTLENLPGSNNVGESYRRPDPSIPNKVKDSMYNFEGYLIYQVFNPAEIGTIEDLDNLTKSRLVKQMDLKNNVSNSMNNFSIVIVNGDTFKNITRTIPLANKGIEHTFVVNDDKFSQEGRSNLVNNKTYHFACVAYAYNNYYDSIKKEKQLTQIKFSKEIKVFSVIPHDISIFGVEPKSLFGQGIPVKRISGKGHGNYFLDLLKDENNISQDEKEIVTKSFKDEITYEGNKSPLQVYVNDPYKVRKADFKLTITDHKSNIKDEFSLDSSSWEIDVDGKTIKSETVIGRPLDQSIYASISNKLESYGISVGTSKADSLYQNANNKNKIYRYIGGELIYEDPKNEWLKFIKDEDGSNYLDWSRSGIQNVDIKKFNSAYNIIVSGTTKTKVFTDPDNEFKNMLSGIVSPYCLTANYSVLTADTNLRQIYSSYGPGFKWRRISTDYKVDTAEGSAPQNNLDSIFSCDIVFTKDPEKWSRCIVLETGESPDFQEFNALKGQLRKAPSRGKDMIEDGTGVGQSYFPGYAINLETGVRVNIYFGENSRNKGVEGGNMIFDPGYEVLSPLKSPILGGSHFVYVTNTKYDEGNADHDIMLANFNKTIGTSITDFQIAPEVAAIYRTFAYTFMPVRDSLFSFYDANNKYSVPTEIRMKIRVQKPYAFYNDGGSFTSVYQFNTNNLAPVSNVTAQQKDAFERMRIVPNPYNAYSVYENSGVQNIVKIVDVPNNCTVSIYTTDGILIRRIKQDVSTNIYGANNKLREIPQDNSITWDMRTNSGVSISSGIYYINVESPEIGTKVLKLFATMRSADVSNF